MTLIHRLNGSSYILEDSFNKPTNAQYWHYLMKHKKEASTYKAKNIQQRVQEIASRLGSNTFSSPQGNLGLTPMHVAAIEGNVAGIAFLLGKNASLQEKDKNGKTALEYLQDYHPKLIPQFLPADPQLPPIPLADAPQPLINAPKPHLNAPIPLADDPTIQKLINGLPKVHLSGSPCLYKENTDDFGTIINTLLFARPNNSSAAELESYQKTGIRIKNVVHNLKLVCKKLGIRLETSLNAYFLRDHWIRLSDSKFVLPSTSPSIKEAIERNESFKLTHQNSASYLTTHEYFIASPGVALGQAKQALDEFLKKFQAAKSLPFYIEGGNHYVVTLNGRRKLIIGADVLQTAHMQFRLDKVFDQPRFDVTHLKNYIELTLTDEKILETIKEMHSQGLLKGSKGLISKKELIDISWHLVTKNYLSNDYPQIAQELGYFTPLKLNIEQIRAHRAIAAKYLAQREMTEMIITKTFSVEKMDLIVLPQLDYHLDVFLQPGPNNSFFVQDYECVKTLITQIQEQAKALELTAKDMKILDRYLASAYQLASQFHPLLTSIKTKLTEEGFTVIPTPGIIYDASPRALSPDNPLAATTYNLNFMNAITGFSPKTQRYFYITTGAQAGDRLGAIMMDVFKAFLRSYQPDIDVYFVGYDPDDPSDFKESMAWKNRLGAQFGIHCLSVATQTEEHKG